jgi:uncharacterized membrane protein
MIIPIAVFMLLLDFVYLKSITPHFNKMMIKIQGKPINFKLVPAILCYSLLVSVFYYFIIKDNKSTSEAFFLGFAIYGIYDTTNMATFFEWDWNIVAIDSLWGGILFALTRIITKRF